MDCPKGAVRAGFRAGGFGLLDAVLTLGIVIIAGVISLSVYGMAAERHRGELLLDEVASIRQSIERAFANELTNSANAITVARVASMGLVDTRFVSQAPATSLRNPWGNPVTVSAGGANGTAPGYVISPGAMPLGACLNLLTSIAQGNNEVTRLSFSAPTPVDGFQVTSASWSGTSLQLTPTMIQTACSVMDANAASSGTLQVEFANIRSATAQTMFVTGNADLTAPNGTTVSVIDAQTTGQDPLGTANATVSTTPSVSISGNGPDQSKVTLGGLGISLVSPPGGPSGNQLAGNATGTLAISAPPGQTIDSIDPSAIGSISTPAGQPGSYSVQVEGYSPNRATVYFTGTLTYSGSPPTSSWTAGDYQGGPFCSSNCPSNMVVDYTVEANIGNGISASTRSVAISQVDLAIGTH